jgi:recombination protein RecA
MRILTPTVNKSKTCLVFINQIRQKIGVMYGDPNTTTGGLALKFYASVRMEVKRITHVKDGEEIIGSETRVRVVKNKIAPPFRNAEFNIINTRGIDFEGDLLKLAVEDDIIEKGSGARYNYKGQQIGHGESNTVQFLRENPTIRDEIAMAVMENRKPKPPEASELEAAAKDEAEAAAELAAIGEAPDAEPVKKKRGKAADKE